MHLSRYFGLVVVACLVPAISLAGHPQPACASPPGTVLLLSGTVAEGGLNGRFTRSVELGTGRFVEKRDYGVIQTGTGFSASRRWRLPGFPPLRSGLSGSHDGVRAWSQDVSGVAHDLNSGFARRLARSELWLAANLGCPRRRDAQMSELSPDPLPHSAGEDGHLFKVMQVVPRGGAPIEVWYDKTTGLPHKAILQYAENRLVRHYDDWRDIGGGLKVPFSQDEEDIEDESTTRFTVEHASLSRNRAPDAFAAPPAPHDVRFLDGHTSSTVPYEDDHRTRIYIPVYLNGKGPFTFELDCGGHFILAPQTMLALGLEPRGAFSSTGAGTDVHKAGYVRIASVRIGSVEINNQVAKVLPLTQQSNDRGAKAARAGILGLELFERLRISVNRSEQTVTLAAPGQFQLPAPWVAAPITFDEDAPLVEGTVAGAHGQLMVDTGNAGSTIVEQYWAAQQGIDHLFDSAPSAGPDTRIAAGSVSIGPFALVNEVFSYYGPQPRGSEYTRSVAAVLGEPLLSRFDLVFDYAAGTLWLKPLADRAAVPFNRSGLLLSKAADGSFKVAGVMAGSPAADEKLNNGDVVDEVAGQPASSLSKSDVMAMFQQPAGTRVEIRLRRTSTDPDRTLTLRLRDLL